MSIFTNYYIAELVLANLCFYLALVLFYRLLVQDFEPTVARNAMFYLAFSPYGVFFFVGYNESLFLMLSLATFFFLQRQRYFLAGLCGFLAALTRAQGVLLIVPFVVVVIQRFWMSQDTQTSWPQKVRASIPTILIPLGVAAYMVYLFYTKGDALAFSTQEALSWDRHLTFPLVSIAATIQTFFTEPDLHFHVLNGLDLAFVLLPLAALILGWKRQPLHYSLFAVALLIFDTSYPQGFLEPLTAAPRYMLVIFPIIVALAIWGKRPHIDRIILACFIPMFVLNVAFFVSHYWVA
jgi:hypothetical protein